MRTRLNLILVLLSLISPQLHAKATTVIVGMGPAGLLSAYQQLKLGHKVTIIEQRADPLTRDRQILLSRSFLRHLMHNFTNYTVNGYELKFGSLLKGDYTVSLESSSSAQQIKEISSTDRQFFDYVIKTRTVVSIKVLQQYLLQKIQSIASHGQLIIINPASVVEIDTLNGRLKLDNHAEPIAFDNLIVADGGRRSITSLLLKAQGQDLKAYGLPIPRAKHSSYGLIRINLRDSNPVIQQNIDSRPIISPLISKSSNMTSKDIQKINDLGWHKNYLPIMHIQYLDDEQQFYIVSEVPEAWLKLSKPEFQSMFLNFAINCLKLEYPALADRNLDITISNASSFILKSTYIEQEYLDFSNNKRAFIIGDALIESNFLVGNGMDNSYKTARAVAKCFDSTGNFISAKPVLNMARNSKIDYLKKNARCKFLFYLNRNPAQKKLFVKVLDAIK